MATEITMPQLGESVTEGTISKWFVKSGDKVNKYDPICEVMTDKVNAEVPSSYTGIIDEIVCKEDETVAVGAVICTIHVEGELLKEESTKSYEKVKTFIHQQNEQKVRYSPAVLHLAQQHQLNLTGIAGSGRGGRITRKDVLDYIERGDKLSKANEIKAVPLKTEQSKLKLSLIDEKRQLPNRLGKDVEIPVTGVRKAIAANMVKSKDEAPHAWTMVEVDVTNLVQYRNEIKHSFKENEGFTITYLPFFIKAVVESLKQYPQLNSMWAGDKIIQKKDINISIAVATEDALFVPVIKHADEKTIKGIAREIYELSNKVRNKTISSNDMADGTFTVNNTGSFGSIQSMPIINYPQAAIMTVESIVKRPIVLENDAIAIRHMVNLCLSLDHRVLDGLVCGRFLAAVKQRLESISKENSPIY